MKIILTISLVFLLAAPVLATDYDLDSAMEYKSAVRAWLGDNDENTYPDSAVLTTINLGCIQYALNVGIIGADTIEVTQGEAIYTLNTDYIQDTVWNPLRVYRMYWQGDDRYLTGMKMNPGVYFGTSGAQSVYEYDIIGQTLLIAPSDYSGDSVILYYHKYPITMNDDGDTTNVPIGGRASVIHWTVWQIASALDRQVLAREHKCQVEWIKCTE